MIIHKANVPLADNALFFKREDLLPFSFGGNKARKAILFFEEIVKLKSRTVVTYGTSSSNHCRVVANMSAAHGLDCVIINPDGNAGSSYNADMVRHFGAKIITCPITDVAEKIKQVREMSDQPYFIQGGGHGDLGTKAYVDCYKEIVEYENSHGVKFDYIFHASGTGTTQAGLVCGNLQNANSHKIVGISIARSAQKGKPVVIQSVLDYCNQAFDYQMVDGAVIFDDNYISGGYGKYNSSITNAIKRVLVHEGIALDPFYTGKAFWGMEEYIKRSSIKNKNILFIHTGGQPIFFDVLEGLF